MSADQEIQNQPPRGPDQVIRLAGIPSEEAFGTPTLWLSASFAPKWFSDARREAAQPHADARRREIVFAVAAAETYLLEWVRDDVLNGNFADLDRFFPPGERRSITDKWREIPKALKDSGLIAAVPNLGGGSAWGDFQRLVEFRNGLLHARSSRPGRAGLPDASLPVPSLVELQSVGAGWPTDVVRRLILDLHASIGTPPPPWLSNA